MFGLLFKLFASLCMQFSEIDVYRCYSGHIGPCPRPGYTATDPHGYLPNIVYTVTKLSMLATGFPL